MARAIAAMPGAYETFRHFVEFEVALTSFQSCFHKYSSLCHLCFVQSMFWSKCSSHSDQLPSCWHSSSGRVWCNFTSWLNNMWSEQTPEVFEVCEFELFDDGREISQKSKNIQIGSKLVCSKLPWGRCFVQFFPSAPHCRKLSFCSQTLRLCNKKKTKKNKLPDQKRYQSECYIAMGNKLQELRGSNDFLPRLEISALWLQHRSCNLASWRSLPGTGI